MVDKASIVGELVLSVATGLYLQGKLSTGFLQSLFFGKIKKQIICLIVNYDVMLLPNRIKFFEVGYLGAGVCLSKKHFSLSRIIYSKMLSSIVMSSSQTLL